MLNNLKYSWRLLKSSGWRAFLSIGILYLSFGFLGTFFVSELIDHNHLYSYNYLHIAIIAYLLIYFDNSIVRFTSPLELNHILVFPKSIMQKFITLVSIEMMSVKFYLVALYIIVQVIVNKLYMAPGVLACIILTYLAYHFLFLNFLLMVKRKVAFLYVFRAFAPVVFVVPFALMKSKKMGHGLTDYIKKGAHFFSNHSLTIVLAFVLMAVICFYLGLYLFKVVLRKYPFYDEELLEKLKARKR